MQTQPNVPEPKKKAKGWGRVLNFLMMGGWILVILIVIAIVIAVISITGK